MINALLVLNKYFNCETFVPKKYESLYEKLGKEDLQKFASKHYKHIPYHPRKAMKQLGVNIIQCSSSNFSDIVINALESGEIIHLIIIDVFALDDSILNFLREMRFGMLNCRFQQDINQVPAIIVCTNPIPHSHNRKLRTLLSIKGESLFIPWFYEYENNMEPVSENYRQLNVSQDNFEIQASRAILAYREFLLSELDMRGFFLNFKAGKIELNPTFKHTPKLHGFAFSNYRSGAERFVFMDKSALAISRSIEKFEELLNVVCNLRCKKSEQRQNGEEQLQRF
jgi:hypothetical protein